MERGVSVMKFLRVDFHNDCSKLVLHWGSKFQFVQILPPQHRDLIFRILDKDFRGIQAN